jgi:hypothetical protein
MAIIATLLVMLFAAWKIYGWYFRSTNNPEPFNKNITFVGNDDRHYNYSQAMQNTDGSIVIASVLSGYRKPQPEVSLIKLSPLGKFEWEKIIHFTQPTFWNLVPSIIRRNKGIQSLNIQSINFVDGSYYLLLNRFNGKMKEPYILKLDVQGKLLTSTKIKLEMERFAPTQSFMQNNYAYLSYLDLKSKMLCLAKLDIKTGNVINNPMLFYKQDSLLVRALTADKADTTVSVTAYDRKTGCSFYMYTRTNDLKEYFRTQPGSEFTVLKYFGDKLYGVVKEDSLLQIVDLTSLSKPLILVTDKPPYQDFRARDLQIINGNLYVIFDAKNAMNKEFRYDAFVRKYSPDGDKPKEYLMQGKGMESPQRIFATADKQIIVIGFSTSTSLDRGVRVFASKFPL